LEEQLKGQRVDDDNEDRDTESLPGLGECWEELIEEAQGEDREELADDED
jgi:hypothetical protein